MENQLAILRKGKGWNQVQAGEKLMLELAKAGKAIKHTYATKKISLFELAILRPNNDELLALSRMYGVSVEEIDGEFRRAPLGAIDFFRNLIDSGHKTLVAAMYGGRQRISSDEEFNRVLKEALTNNVCLAMFFPYPRGESLTKKIKGPAEERKTLSHIYEDVYLHAWGRYELLCDGIPENSRDQVAFYEPDIEGSVPIYIPPFAHRLTLVVQEMDDKYTSTLYSWIETEELEAFYRLGTFTTVNFEQQYLAWQAYFGKPLADWKKKQKFHDDDNGFWKRRVLYPRAANTEETTSVE